MGRGNGYGLWGSPGQENSRRFFSPWGVHIHIHNIKNQPQNCLEDEEPITSYRCDFQGQPSFQGLTVHLREEMRTSSKKEPEELPEMVDESDSTDNSSDEDYREGDQLLPSKRRKIQTASMRKPSTGKRRSESHSCSRLFEIVMMKKHAKLSSCLQRIYMTLSSSQRYTVVADILSLICECAGFRQLSITSEDVQESPADTDRDDSMDDHNRMDNNGSLNNPMSTHTSLDNHVSIDVDYECFDWFSLQRYYDRLPESVSYEDVCAPMEEPRDLSPLIYPIPSDLGKSKRGRSISSKFYLLCNERAKKISKGLIAENGWAIGFGSKNPAYLRFKEFFQRLVADVDAMYFKDVLLLLQWIFALSTCGYRSVRTLSCIACNEILLGLLLRLESLSRDESVYTKQLSVEVALDKKTHERMYGVSDGKITLANSTIELWKRLKMANMSRFIIKTFVMIIFDINFKSKLYDVLPDVRVITSYYLLNCLAVNRGIFSSVHYTQTAAAVLGDVDSCTRLLLLRFIFLSSGELHLDALAGMYHPMEDQYTLQILELLFLKNVAGQEKHPVLLNAIKGLLWRCSEYLSILFARMFIPHIASTPQVPNLLTLEGLKARYRNVLTMDSRMVSRMNELVQSIPGFAATTHSMYDLTQQSKENALLTFFSSMGSIPEANMDSFIYNLVKGFWSFGNIFHDISLMLKVLCKGGSLSSNYTLEDREQRVLLQIILVSLENMLKDPQKFGVELKNAVDVFMASAGTLIRLHKANVANLSLILQMLEMVLILANKLGVCITMDLVNAVTENVSDFLTSTHIVCVKPCIRALSQMKGYESTIKGIYSKYIASIDIHSSHAEFAAKLVVYILHYFPDLEVDRFLVEMATARLGSHAEAVDTKLDVHHPFIPLACALFEAHVFKCITNKSGGMDKLYAGLRNRILSLLCTIDFKAKSHSEKFAIFSTICSLAQLTSLVDGSSASIPLGVEDALFELSLIFTSANIKGATQFSLKNTGSTTLLDSCMKEQVPTKKPIEMAVSTFYQLTSTFNAQIYSCAASVLLFFQVASPNASIRKACLDYLHFLQGFDGNLFYALLLHILIGLYETCNRDVLDLFLAHFVDGITFGNTLLLEAMLHTALLYVHSRESNWAFLKTLTLLVRIVKTKGVELSSGILNEVPGATKVPGIAAFTTLLSDDPDGIQSAQAPFNASFEGLKSKIGGVKFVELCNVFYPSSRVIHRKSQERMDGKGMNGVMDTMETVEPNDVQNGQDLHRDHPSTHSMETHDEHSDHHPWLPDGRHSITVTSSPSLASPVPVRTFSKKSHENLPPSVGLRCKSVTPIELRDDDLELEDIVEVQEYEPVAEDFASVSVTTKSSCIPSTLYKTDYLTSTIDMEDSPFLDFSPSPLSEFF